jgi:hypothetical protein
MPEVDVSVLAQECETTGRTSRLPEGREEARMGRAFSVGNLGILSPWYEVNNLPGADAGMSQDWAEG